MNAHCPAHAGVPISDERRPDETPRTDEPTGEDAVPVTEGTARETTAGTTSETTDPTAGPSADPSTGENAPKENPWAAITPWRGKAAPLDKLLLFVIIGVPVVYLAILPLRPWMLVNAPVLQEFINGAKTAIVAAGAYARVGEIPLWLVVVAGFVGMAKFDWAFWLAGRRWADGVLRLFAQNERQLRRIQRLKEIPTWALFFMTLIARCPGVPGTLVFIVAGWSGMRLAAFLIADLLGCLIFTLIWAILGFQLGQAAVDVLSVVDKYALWITLAIVIGTVAFAVVKETRKANRKD